VGTLGCRLSDTGGRPTGFDYLRLLLSSLVIVFHSIGLCYGNGYADYLFSKPGIHAASTVVLPMFFSLSGFLVAGSLERNRSVIGFLGLRAIRIYPALTVEVVLSAFVLGTIFTTVPLPTYFTSHEFYHYLINVTGHISYVLPGVFLDNPVPAMVNRQLWTVPFELYCYLALTTAMLVGLTKRPRAFVLAIAAVQVFHFGLFQYLGGDWLHPEKAGHLDGTQLVFSFLAGVALYLHKDSVPWSRTCAIVTAALGIALLSFRMGDYLAVFPLAYLTAYVGLLNPRKVGIIRGADYSYGIYLYGWPMQQALVATGAWARHWPINIAAAMLCSAAFAAVSWHCVEKPALRLRGPLKRVETRWLSFRASISTQVPSLS
jgi:peptidoglycan/LPS O-acetylase OafA/YrhL